MSILPFRALQTLLLASGVGCSSDLFHSTAWSTACDSTPSAQGCPGYSPDGSSDSDAAGDETDSDAKSPPDREDANPSSDANTVDAADALAER